MEEISLTYKQAFITRDRQHSHKSHQPYGLRWSSQPVLVTSPSSPSETAFYSPPTHGLRFASFYVFGVIIIWGLSYSSKISVSLNGKETGFWKTPFDVNSIWDRLAKQIGSTLPPKPNRNPS